MVDKLKGGENFSQNLKRMLEDKGMLQIDLAEKLGVSPATVTFWLKGSLPKGNRLNELCKILNVEPADLLLSEDILTRKARARCKEIPLYGNISAGNGFFAESNVVRYIAVDDAAQGDFAVIVAGDSMTGAGICDGDIAIFAKSFRFHEGNIYAVWQTGEELSFVKRVYLNGNRYLLLSENSNYAPIIIENNEARILGELTGLYRQVRQ